VCRYNKIKLCVHTAVDIYSFKTAVYSNIDLSAKLVLCVHTVRCRFTAVASVASIAGWVRYQHAKAKKDGLKSVQVKLFTMIPNLGQYPPFISKMRTLFQKSVSVVLIIMKFPIEPRRPIFSPVGILERGSVPHVAPSVPPFCPSFSLQNGSN
jgi:hypothetical protein